MATEEAHPPHGGTGMTPGRSRLGAPGTLAVFGRRGPVVGRARLAFVAKLSCATLLTVGLLLSLLDVYLGLLLAIGFVAATVLLDYWVYRAADDLFRSIEQRNRRADLHEEADGLQSGMERLLESVVSGDRTEGLAIETVRADLYRLRDLNN